jgi:TatD DNase family protein
MTLTTAPPKLIDIGLNLAHDSFDRDREEVLQRAEAAGVEHMIVTGSTIASTESAIAMVKRYPARLRATAGIHPHHAGELQANQKDILQALIAAPEAVAIGECGLDYFRNFSSHADQERAFRMQLELATQSRKPLFLHQRDAHDSFTAILKEYLPRTSGGVAHCFTEDYDKARQYLDMGLYVGVTGWLCDERRGQVLRDVVRRLPLDRLLIETDAPYLLPRDLDPKPKSRRNEPIYLPHILRAIARCRDEDFATIAAATTANATKLFGWP